MDSRLRLLVKQELFDFGSVATLLNDELSTTFTGSMCRLRYAHLNLKEEEEADGTEEEEEDEEEEAAVVWTPEVDRLLITVCNECSFDFIAVSVELGKRLNRKSPVNDRLCRMRYAALDKYNLSGSKQEENKEDDDCATESTAASNTSTTTSAAATSTSTPPTAPTASCETVMLELPPDALLNALASSFEQDSKQANDANVAPYSFPDTKQRDSNEELSELGEILAFLDSEEANTDTKDSASFQELFGIPESELDRAIDNLPSEFEDTKRKPAATTMELPDVKFDLTKFAATFDRVAKAIGATTEAGEQ